MSIATQITRITGLRNRIRTKLISLGLISNQSADLEACTTAIETLSGEDIVIKYDSVTKNNETSLLVDCPDNSHRFAKVFVIVSTSDITTGNVIKTAFHQFVPSGQNYYSTVVPYDESYSVGTLQFTNATFTGVSIIGQTQAIFYGDYWILSVWSTKNPTQTT